MAIFRQYIAPLIVVLIFLVALVAVSARIFISEDMAAPAPITETSQHSSDHQTIARTLPSLDVLINGLPEEPGMIPML
jgi:hypothetical protein